jgi:hypothetical protein
MKYITSIVGYSYVGLINFIHLQTLESSVKIVASVVVGTFTTIHLLLQIKNQLKKKKIYNDLIKNSKS